jgi:hypothetical protein
MCIVWDVLAELGKCTVNLDLLVMIVHRFVQTKRDLRSISTLARMFGLCVLIVHSLILF